MSVTPLIGATKFVNGVPQVPDVSGGSGREYFTPQQGLDLETGIVVLDTTAAGTINGKIVATAGVVTADGVFDGRQVVVTDLAAVNGGIAETATIIRSVAATGELFLNRPFNVTVGKTYAIIKEKKIAVNRSFENDVLSVTGDAEINLGDNTVKEINVTGTVRYLKVIGGNVRNGINWSPTAVGVLILDKTKVSWRSGTPGDAVRMTPTVDAYGLEILNSDIDGRASGNAGRTRWTLNNVTNPGFAGAVGTNGFSVVNARGAAVTARNVAIVADRVDGTVVLLHAESAGSIVTAAPFFDMRCNIGGWPLVSADTSVPAKQVSIGQVDDTSTLAATITDLASFLSANIQENGDFAILRARSSSGAGAFTSEVPINIQQFMGDCSIIKTEGACSGAKTVTLNGDLNCELTDAVNMLGFLFTGAWTGAGSIPAGTGRVNVKDAGRVSPINHRASQVAGAPTATFAPTLVLLNCNFLNIFHLEAGVTVSTGTWINSATKIGMGLNTYHCTLPTILADEVTFLGTATGGAWTDSGDTDASFTSARFSVIRVARNGATAAVTLTVSGNSEFFGGGHVGTQTCASVTATATTVRSGTTFYSRTDLAPTSTFPMAVNATVAGAVATLTGAIEYSTCDIGGTGAVIANSAGSVTVPGSFVLHYCAFDGTFALRTGAGAFAGACNVFENYCEHVDAFSINAGAIFPVVIGEMCQYLADPAALIFIADPVTTFRFNKCSFPNGRYYAINGLLTLGKPTIVDDEIVSDAGVGGATTELGNQYDSTARLIDLAAASNNVTGIGLGTDGVGARHRNIVHGFGFLVAGANQVTAQGDPVGPSGVAPFGRVETAVVKRIGYAIDAAAFPVPDTTRFYARIHVDR